MNLETRGVAVYYGERAALENVSLTVAPGEVVAVIGPNGAGKSTLIRAISGVTKISAGEIFYGETNLAWLGNAARARILSVVPQAQQLGGPFTVAQTVMLGRTAYMNWLGQPRARDEQAAAWALEQTSLQGLATRRNAELSGGEQQRVLLARALAQKTPVLLLDEPTNHLDLQHQVQFLSLVRRLARQENLAVLMALHDLNQVATYADRVMLLVSGRVLAEGAPEAVLTLANVTAAYGLAVTVIQHPEYGTPLVLPRRQE